MAEISPRTTWKLAKALRGKRSKPPRNDGVAVVTRVDRDGTRWVRMPGASTDTPVNGSVVANATVGESVSYRVEDGRLSITGNASDPAIGVAAVDAVVAPVARVAALARQTGASAGDAAEAARKIAEAIGQHFWADDNGAHISTEAGNPVGSRNALWNSLGMLFRAGTSNLLALVTGADPGMDVYDGAGNAAGNIIAAIHGSGIRIGPLAGLHSIISASRFAIDYATDNIFGVSTDGITTEVYVGGSTLPTGVSYTNAAVESMLDYFNGGCTPFVSGDDAYVQDADGDSTGYTLDGTDLTSLPHVLDGLGRGLTSAHYDGIFWDDVAAEWQLDRKLVPMQETDAMPAHASVGGVKATMVDGRLTLLADNLAVDWNGIIDAGQSESTVAIGSDIRAAATNQIWSNGVVCTVTLSVAIDDALADGATVTVGIIPEGYRPPYGVYAPCAAGSVHGQSDCFMSTNASGAITLRNRHGAQIAAGRYFAATFTYAL